MDSEAVRERAQLLRDRNRRRRLVERYAPEMDDRGVRYQVLTEPERTAVLELSRHWNRAHPVPAIREEIDLASMSALVAWLDEELPLAEVGEPVVAPVRADHPFFRVQLTRWDEIIALVTRWRALQVVAGSAAAVLAGKNVAIEMPASYETHYAVRVDQRMY